MWCSRAEVNSVAEFQPPHTLNLPRDRPTLANGTLIRIAIRVPSNKGLLEDLPFLWNAVLAMGSLSRLPLVGVAAKGRFSSLIVKALTGICSVGVS